MKDIVIKMMKDYICNITGKDLCDIDIEIVEDMPVIVKEGYYHIYVSPKFLFIGTLCLGDIDFVVKLSQIAPELSYIYNKVSKDCETVQ